MTPRRGVIPRAAPPSISGSQRSTKPQSTRTASSSPSSGVWGRTSAQAAIWRGEEQGYEENRRRLSKAARGRGENTEEGDASEKCCGEFKKCAYGARTIDARLVT